MSYRNIILFIGYASADIYVSLNGGSETHVYMLDTTLLRSEVDLGSDDHLLFEKGSKVSKKNYYISSNPWDIFLCTSYPYY